MIHIPPSRCTADRRISVICLYRRFHITKVRYRLLLYHSAYIVHVLPSCYISSVCPIKKDIERGASSDTPLKFVFTIVQIAVNETFKYRHFSKANLLRLTAARRQRNLRISPFFQKANLKRHIAAHLVGKT